MTAPTQAARELAERIIRSGIISVEATEELIQSALDAQLANFAVKGPRQDPQNQHHRAGGSQPTPATPSLRPRASGQRVLHLGRGHHRGAEPDGAMKYSAEYVARLEAEIAALRADKARLHQILTELMPFVLEDYFPDFATNEFVRAVEAAKEVIKGTFGDPDDSMAGGSCT